MEKIIAEQVPEEEVEAAAGPKPKRAKYILPVVANFRRTKQGRRLVAQEMDRLLQLQATKMPSKSLLDVKGVNVKWASQGQSGSITLEELKFKAGHFFDEYFTEIRTKVIFGSRVHGWLTEVDKGICDFKCEPLHQLVAMISLSDLAATRGYKVDADEDENEDDDDFDN